MPTPSARSDSIIRLESSDGSGAEIRLGPSAIAASTSSRFVSDFEPGMVSVASTAPSAPGAANAPLAGAEPSGEYAFALIGSTLVKTVGLHR